MLIGKYKVESDDLNVTLFEKHKVQKDTKNSKKGDIYWTTIGYYSSVGSALKALVILKVNESGLKDLQTVQKEIDKLNKMIEDIDPASIPRPVTRSPVVSYNPKPTRTKSKKEGK